MTPEIVQTTTRRIAITLDASEAGRPALETCVRLAAILGARLEGIFVEDINLIRLSGLSFLREVRPSSLGEESVSAQRMQRELRTLARYAERMLEQAAQEMGVPWSFQVWRGNAGADTLTRTFAADILGLGRTGARSSRQLRMASATRAYPSRKPPTTISVLFSASNNAQRALATAAHLAPELDASLTVLLQDTSAESFEALKDKARSQLAEQRQTARFAVLANTGAASLAQAVASTATGILIAEADHPLFRQAGLEPCLETLSCPVLLVR